MPRLDLNQADTRFEALAESAPDAILTIDEESTILSANAAVERLFGYSPSELVGRPLTTLIPERLRAAHNAGIARYLRTGRRNIPWTGVQLPALTRDGREIPVEISFGQFIDENNRRVFSGFVRDVSERVRYQQELEAAHAATASALKELTTLARVTDVALTRSTYDDMVQELLRRLRQELNADEATILLLDEGRSHLGVHASEGPHVNVGAHVRIPIGDGVSGRVAATGRSLVRNDPSSTEVPKPGAPEELGSVAAVPVRTEREVIGVLRVGSRGPRGFTKSDVRLLEVVAERMGATFALTRLYQAERQAREEAERAHQALAEHEEALRRLNAELEDRAREEGALRSLAQSITGAVRVAEVMHQIAEGALSVSEAVGAYVEQVVGPDVEVVAAAGALTPPVGQRVPYPGSLTEEIIARREPAFCTEMQSFGAAMAPYLDQHCHGCSVLVAPLLGEEQVLGALVLLRRPDEPRFEHGIVNRVRTLGDLASLALQRLIALAESERRRAEAEAAVRSRDEVLSIVSHDLRNPVSTVAMTAALLQDPEVVLSEGERRQQLEVIARSAHRMNRLIQDLLDVARIEGRRLTLSCKCENPATLAAEACEAFHSIATEKSLSLRCQTEPGLRPVHVDRDRVLQVLSNYLNNAVKFTPAGGSILVSVTRSEEDGVQFAVSDTGPGIAAADLPYVFTRFWQAKRSAHLGSGLGLAIAKGIAEAHRGRVWLETSLGSGSTFFFALPHSDACL